MWRYHKDGQWCPRTFINTFKSYHNKDHSLFTFFRKKQQNRDCPSFQEPTAWTVVHLIVFPCLQHYMSFYIFRLVTAHYSMKVHEELFRVCLLQTWNFTFSYTTQVWIFPSSSSFYFYFLSKDRNGHANVSIWGHFHGVLVFVKCSSAQNRANTSTLHRECQAPLTTWNPWREMSFH